MVYSNKIMDCSEQLLAAVKGRTMTETFDSKKQIPCIVVGLNESCEVVSSTETKVFDLDTSGGNHSSFQELDEDLPAPDVPKKKMPKRKRDPEELNNNHVEASKDVPRPKKLQKKPDEILRDHQLKELFDVPDSDTSRVNRCSLQEPDEYLPAPDIPNKKMPKRKRDHEDAKSNCGNASKDVPQPKKLQKKPTEIYGDHQLKEPLGDPVACQQRIVLAKQMTNLSNLTYDLLVEIAKRLEKLEHFTCFRSVSKSLHLAVKDEYFEGIRLRKGTPYLMLPVREDGTNDDVRELYSLVEGESTVVSLKVPMLKKATMCNESLGWLLAVQVDGSMSLLDPFSNMEIPVPHQHTIPEYERRYTTKKEHMLTFIKKMVLSSKPNETSNFIMMVICGYYSSLAFWRSGDEAWNRIDTSTTGFSDVVYDGGQQFYAINVRGSIWVINLAGGHVECRIIIDRGPDLGIVSDLQNQYILKSIDGSLLCIIRSKEEQCYLTYLFSVYEIDPEAGTLKEIKMNSLESMAFFLGRNSSIAVDTSKFPNTGVIKAKHIYFTDDFSELQEIYFTDNWRVHCPDLVETGNGVDSGVYNYRTACVGQLYPVDPLLSHVCPAMFINPNLSF